GVLQWQRRYDGTAHGTDDCFGLAVDAAGNVYACGETTSTTTGRDLLMLKYDTAGTLLWARVFDGVGGGGSEFAYGLAVGAAGQVVVTGSSPSAIGDDDAVTIEY